MDELLNNYAFNDGEIISLDLMLNYQFPNSLPISQATIVLAVRKWLTATRWQPCQLRLQFQKIHRVSIFEDFTSVNYTDIILKRVEKSSWYLSLDPHGNTGEPHDQDNLVIIADTLTITEIS